nr:MAG TPA: hypothetical protein [Caudoviricetes sp.]
MQFRDKPPRAFRNCPDIYKAYTRGQLGICLNALWNALAKSRKYSNRNVVIFYKNIESLNTITWR